MNMQIQLKLLIPAMLVAITGCDFQPGGGAALVPAVTVLPADLGGTAAGVNIADTSAGADSGSVSSTAGGPGTFAGRVVMVGNAPQLGPLIAQGADVKDKEVCSAEPVPDQRLVLSSDGQGVANVFVYLARAPKGTPAPDAAADAVIFDQKGCKFIPHCLLLWTGQTIKVLSDDSVAHNTHTYPARNQSVSSLVPANDREGSLELVYPRAEGEPFRVTCDFHTWMIAYHLPLDHPYAALTDENGNFEIPNLPAGDHEFVVWHEAAKGNFIERKLKVTVKAGETTQQDIEYSSDKLAL